MNGLSLGEFAGVLAAVGAILGGLLTWSTSQANANAKVHEGRVKDLQEAIENLREDMDRQREDMERQRASLEKQLADVREAMVSQARTIHRQEITLADYARHVGKLERIMAGARLEIPEFETSYTQGQV